MRIIRCKNSVTAILSNGRILQSSGCTDEMFEKIKTYQKENNEFELINLFIPENEEETKNTIRCIQFWKDAEGSSCIVRKEDSAYWKEVSPLSLPLSFAEKIVDAEKKGDASLLNAYKNFWTLLSLNQDETVRENLFKFLDKWGMQITKSGLFIGYRNADIFKEGEDLKDSVFTDHYSHSTKIKIGQMVTLPRKACDCDSNVECSRGLHIGGTSWLERNYFGTVGLVCLVNPVDVVAVPWARAEYGKLRTCAYLPIDIAEYDNFGNIVPFNIDSGMEEPFVTTILYDGIMAEEKEAKYHIPVSQAENPKSVSEKILNIARQFIKK